MTSPPSPIIVALDYGSATEATRFTQRIEPELCAVKVGKELFVAAGPAMVEQLVERGFRVFLDLKFHDIPNTVASACRAAANLGVWMLNVHACGGAKMLLAAREAIASSPNSPLLIAVTVLTSMTEEDWREIGMSKPIVASVEVLAQMAQAAGCDGVVCSAQEASTLRRRTGPQFKLVTPGIRLAGAPADDQSRIVTPIEARRFGADYLVIGRPITKAAEPISVLQQILRDLQQHTT